MVPTIGSTSPLFPSYELHIRLYPQTASLHIFRQVHRSISRPSNMPGPSSASASAQGSITSIVLPGGENKAPLVFATESEAQRRSRVFDRNSKENRVGRFQTAEDTEPRHALGVNVSISREPLGYKVGASFLHSSHETCPPLSPVVDRFISAYPKEIQIADRILPFAQQDLFRLYPETMTVVERVKDPASRDDVSQTEVDDYCEKLSGLLARRIQGIADEIYGAEKGETNGIIYSTRSFSSFRSQRAIWPIQDIPKTSFSSRVNSKRLKLQTTLKLSNGTSTWRTAYETFTQHQSSLTALAMQVESTTALVDPHFCYSRTLSRAVSHWMTRIRTINLGRTSRYLPESNLYPASASPGVVT